MNDILLTALDESHFPISAMAAFGVLQVLTLSAVADAEEQASPAAPPPRLSWQERPRWTAVLHTYLTRDEVVETLTSAATRVATAPVWTTHSDLRDMTPAGYRALLQADISQADQQVAAAFACEWPLRGSASKGVQNGEKLLLTPFFMTSGQQRWCKIICDAARASARPNPGSDNPIAEALFGPWRYVQQVSALGWDPATERHYALEAKAPTDSKPISVAAAVWLAAESLALFPSFGVGRTLRVPCFDQVGQTFFWPLWRAPLSIDAVRAMLRLPLAKSGQGGDRNEATALQRQLRMRGIAAVFASRRGASPAGHGYFVFSPSQLLWSS